MYTNIAIRTIEYAATTRGPFRPRSDHVLGRGRVFGPRIDTGKLTLSEKIKFRTAPAMRAEAR
jgi:hypothetical protein